MRLRSKKTAIAAGAAAALLAAGSAYAFFTDSGSGTGSASVGSSTDIAITGTTAGALFPDGPSRVVTITLTNNGDGAQYVDTVSLASITTTAAGCVTSLNGANSAFTFANPVVVDQTIPPHDDHVVTGNLQMNDTGLNQDACQGAALTLNFTSN